jgi:two-component system chemotaxis response regulator CheY
MERVLIIDDDDLMLEILRELLEQGGGYEVVIANNGVRGVELFKTLNPGLVITDLIMPHTNGVHVIQEIRRHSPNARIIAMSGTPRIDTLAEAVQAQANRVITKPFDQDEILDAMAELLDYSAPRV